MIPFSYLAFVTVSASGAVTDVYDLLDGGRYSLVEYAPAVAPRRVSRLGGSGDYQEVTDTLVVDVWGDTAAQCSEAANALIDLMDQAARWYYDDAVVEAVQIRMQALRGTAGELAAVVLGPAPGDEPPSLAPVWDQDERRWLIRELALRFGRRGALLDPDRPGTVVSPFSAGDIATVFQGDHPTLSPIELVLTSGNVLVDGQGEGFLIAQSAASTMQIIDLKTGTSLSNFTVVAAASARSGQVLQHSGAVVTGSATYAIANTLPAQARRIHAFITAGSTADRQHRVAVKANYGSRTDEVSVIVPVISVGFLGTQALYVGQLDTLAPWTSLTVEAVPLAAGVGSLQLDMLLLVADMGPETTIIGLPSLFIAGTDELVIDPGALTRRDPALYVRNNGTQAFTAGVDYRGDIYPQQRGDYISVCLFATGPGQYWRMASSIGVVQQFALIATRNRAWRVPQ